MQSQRFLKAKEKSHSENRIFVTNNLAFIDQLYHVLAEKDWTQKKLAQELGKSESEISKWMSGLHNFTFKTVAKLQAVLGKELLVTPKSYAGKYTAKVELHAQRMVKEARQSFQYTDVVVYDTKLDILSDGQHIVKRAEKQFCFDKPKHLAIWDTGAIKRPEIQEKDGPIAA